MLIGDIRFLDARSVMVGTELATADTIILATGVEPEQPPSVASGSTRKMG